jgi:hypothetical protein
MTWYRQRWVKFFVVALVTEWVLDGGTRELARWLAPAPSGTLNGIQFHYLLDSGPAFGFFANPKLLGTDSLCS